MRRCPVKFSLGAHRGEHTSGGAAFFLQVYDSKCIALITCQKWTFWVRFGRQPNCTVAEKFSSVQNESASAGDDALNSPIPT
jgi:hypothetical protein